ncbi:MAG: phosphate acyltransferase PlsX [Anaeroplasma sp.]
MIKIVVDLMGADNSPKILAPGAIKAINENPNLYVILCGKKDLILEGISNLEYNVNQIEIVDCQEEITNYDVPTIVFKTKPNSSLVKGLKICRDNDDVKAFTSCGSTGAVLASSIFILGKISRIRPALSSVLGGLKKDFCIVDCGANSDCRAIQLLEFAQMGTAFMQTKGVNNPKVVLLSNGAEDQKGSEIIKNAHLLLKESKLNFCGNIEGKDILSSGADVIVCDGFSGNVALKTIEGTANAIFKNIDDIARKSLNKENNEIYHKIISDLKNRYDYNSLGGAVLLGVNKPVVKGHGAAVSETIYNICNLAYTLAYNDLTNKIKNILN